jgi:hypothetical protein
VNGLPQALASEVQRRSDHDECVMGAAVDIAARHAIADLGETGVWFA